MRTLQKQFMSVVETMGEQQLMRAVLNRATVRNGVELTEQQLATLVDTIKNATSNEITIPHAAEIHFEVSDTDVQMGLQDFEAGWQTRVDGAIEASVEEFSPIILKTLYETAPLMLATRRREIREFRRRLAERWRGGIDRLEMLVVIAEEIGSAFLEKIRTHKESDEDWDADLAAALAGLHVRACRAAQEVLALLASGFADGANSRWRSLHELAVTAKFLAERRGDIGLRYLRHSDVERHKAAVQYEDHCDSLGYDHMSQTELDELRRRYNEAIADFGIDFKSDYGWAASALGKPSPRFTDIERSVNFERWRPFYKMACHSVHAGSQGHFFSLGSPRDTPLVNSGASDAGLADPGHSAAISLTIATTALLELSPELDDLVGSKIMLLITRDAGDAFYDAHVSIGENQAEIEKTIDEAEIKG